MKVCSLTKLTALAYGLPVTEVFLPRGVTDSRGVKHPSNIFELWDDLPLRKKGFAHLDESVIPDGHRSTGFTDKLISSRVKRTHATEVIPPVPDPKPGDAGYDATRLRRRHQTFSDHDMLEALWGREVNANHGPADAIEAERAALKIRFP